MPPTAVQPLPSDAAMHAPLPMTPIPQDQQEAAEVQELRKDVASLSQQLNAALAMLNTLSVSAAAATESAQIAAAAATAAALSNTAPQGQLGPLTNETSVQAAATVTVRHAPAAAAWIPNDFCVYDGSTDQYGGASAAGIVPSPSSELTEASMSSNTH